MSPEVTAAVIAASVSFLTLIGTVIAQIIGFRSTSANTKQQIQATHKDTADTLRQQSDQLKQTLSEQRTRTLNERFAAAAGQLGDDKPPAVRLAGVYAMAGLADDWPENRQTCVDVLCGYLRLPYDPGPVDEADRAERAAHRANREVRYTVIRLIGAHLKDGAARSWQGLNFDFTGAVFDGGSFTDARFSGGEVSFRQAEFSGSTVSFYAARFCGGTVDFSGARFSGGEVSFRRSVFSSGTVEFDAARFSGGKVIFRHGVFSGTRVNFRTAQFSGGEVDFSDADDWSSPPAFPWTGTPPSGVKLSPTEGQSRA